MGTKVTGERVDIYQEEVDYRSALSENLMTKMAKGVNFINDSQLSTFNFRFLGNFQGLSGGEDGILVLPMNIEVIGYSGHLRLVPTSSILSIDIHKVNSSGADQGSILENSIQINTSASNGVVWYTNQLASTENNPTGVLGGAVSEALPTVDTTSFLAGEGMRIDIDATLAMGCEDLSFNIWYRPA